MRADVRWPGAAPEGGAPADDLFDGGEQLRAVDGLEQDPVLLREGEGRRLLREGAAGDEDHARVELGPAPRDDGLELRTGATRHH